MFHYTVLIFRYYFSYYALSHGDHKAELTLEVGGKFAAGSHSKNRIEHGHTAGAVVVVRCNEDQQVLVRCWRDGTDIAPVYTGVTTAAFSGALLYPF